MTTTESPTRGPAPDAPGRHRRTVVLAAVAAVVVAALVALLVVLDGDGGTSDSDRAAASSTAGTAPEAGVVPNPPTPTPTGPTEVVDQLPPELPEVALDSPAPVGNGVVATLTAVEAIEGTANGPGNIAGPAVRVTVRIENGTTQPIAVAGAAVNMYYGADRTPASPLDDPSQRPFGLDMVEPGGTADGVYVFTVPADQRDLVTVEVGYEAGAPLLVFSGPVD
ncbi:hypothetical protein ACI797_03405 [Geodermatophilus sp. SYSU D00691]